MAFAQTGDDDVSVIVPPLLSDYGEMSKLTFLGYTSVAEELAERFHMDQKISRDSQSWCAVRGGRDNLWRHHWTRQAEASSHGCVRLTNWDAEELAKLVKKGTTVEFPS